MKTILYVDLDKCLACKTCELQCAIEHSQSKDLFKAIEEEPLPQARVKVEAYEDLAVPLQCRHCEDAPCIKICPTKALEKLAPGEPVIIKEDLCIGCKWCLLVCPFGVLNLNREGKVIIKCDLCLERLEKGEEPACVEACPTKALKLLSPEEVAKLKKAEFLVGFKKDGKTIKG
ncbi:Iron-sulfur protein [subsurface metagenome]|nr:4Fe-4S dicluster domain-containing protein [Clostridia bacterium]